MPPKSVLTANTVATVVEMLHRFKSTYIITMEKIADVRDMPTVSVIIILKTPVTLILTTVTMITILEMVLIALTFHNATDLMTMNVIMILIIRLLESSISLTSTTMTASTFANLFGRLIAIVLLTPLIAHLYHLKKSLQCSIMIKTVVLILMNLKRWMTGSTLTKIELLKQALTLRAETIVNYLHFLINFY